MPPSDGVRKPMRRTRRILRRRLIIAIDGPAGSGKSSTAKALAKALKLPYIDTGAMYRAITLKAMRARVPMNDPKALLQVAKKARIRLVGSDPARQRVFLDGKDVTRAIREPELTKNVVHVAKTGSIRREMVKKQRRMGGSGGAVMEGRDIGTQVFPNADLKLYFEADPRIRARRRYRELKAAGRPATLARVLKEILYRDQTDTTRREGPLRRARDAFFIDTSSLTIPETVDKILAVIHAKSLNGVGLRPLKSR